MLKRSLERWFDETESPAEIRDRPHDLQAEKRTPIGRHQGGLRSTNSRLDNRHSRLHRGSFGGSGNDIVVRISTWVTCQHPRSCGISGSCHSLLSSLVLLPHGPPLGSERLFRVREHRCGKLASHISW